MRATRSIALAISLLIGASGYSPTLAAPAWVEQGPGPILNGGEENLSGGAGLPNPVTGAINAILADPVSPDILYVGSVSGGVWRTTNATAAAPTWTPLTDQQLPELSINSLAVSPANPATLFAGTGSTTSFNRFGSLGIGVARSTDGGASWTVLAGTTFAGKAINSVVPTTLDGGNIVLAATWLDQGGVWRSTDNGTTFSRISGNGTSGLPDAGVNKLISDPGNPNRFYAGVPFCTGGGAQAGVYRSDDGGLTWSQINTGLSGLGTSLRILLSVHNDASNNVVYADVITTSDCNTTEGATLAGVFRSTNQGGNWANLGVPSPSIYPGQQGFFHGGFAADPTNPNVVFISGDTQPSPFPNANGCNTFSGTLFRWTGASWELAVCNGANHTSPHADSRFLTFDAAGNLLQGNDGGIVRLVNPNNSATRSWVPVDGNLRTTEFHSVAYDPLSNITFGGLQDNGTAYLLSPGNFPGNELLGGDGAVVGIDADQTAHVGTTLRYSSFQSLASFNRTTWNSANTRISGFTPVGLNITAGPGSGQTLRQFDGNVQFYNPFVLNAIDPSRMLIGTANIYESLNRGDSLNNLGFTGAFIGSFAGWGRPMAYGSRLNGTAMPDVFYVGAGSQILHRVAMGSPIITLSAYPGGAVITIAMNPQNYRQVFVVDDNSRVWGSFNEGASWIELTGNLPSLSGLVTTLEVFAPDATIRNTVLIAGGFGAFQMPRPGSGGSSWIPLSSALPNALVLDLNYNYTANVLAAGTLGRGSWTLSSFFRGGGGTTPAIVSSPLVSSTQRVGMAATSHGAASLPIPSPPVDLVAPAPSAHPEPH